MRQLDAATGGNAAPLLAAERENQRLRRQVEEMETFLNDYGLKWVGTSSGGGGDAPPPPIDTDRDVLLPWTEGAATVPQLDLDLLIARIHDLNTIILEERGGGVVRSGRRARLSRPDTVALSIYADGLSLGGEGSCLRRYDAVDTQAFIRDVLDGFFPSELRRRYPDGFLTEVQDR
ncbi:hypothetical protein JKP88DRAFT_158683, partial [Tribonema minus]